ncbi:rho guanine nucleotide exchange factor 17 isoform X2 [Dendroctonus ponderosae]|uniref:DH domain-containing protein n=1 Tax=Dendroctonus ponderosae TaxID=77166 RepID=A0AAR5PWL3_DENPD|nr:rho guanine nucleotide exchange factor 17 isoform X2 [Dendroctonus ponderosae]
MSSPWQEGCLARCQDCANACPHFPGLSHEEPYKRFMTIGPVRYGMRVGAVSPPPPGAGPRYRSRTCCWPAAPHDTTSRIPLLPVAASPINSLDIISCANRSEDAATSEQTQTVRDHVLYPGGCLLNKRCALVYSRLVDAEPKDEIATLDRLPRFRFGGNRAEKRGSDKFRELTERLKRSAAFAPVPPPRRHTRATPPPPEPPLLAQRAPLPLRSASFSQVDYCPDDNKYVRRNNHQDSTDTSHNTLPRPKNLPKGKQDAFTSTSPVVEHLEQFSRLAPSKDIPEVQIISESPEKTLVRPPQDSVGSSSIQDRRRDNSRKREGIYLSQWPAEYYSNDVGSILPKYEAEDIVGTCEETNSNQESSIIGSSLQEEPDSPHDTGTSLEWLTSNSHYSNTLNNNNNRQSCQSPDQKDSLKVALSRSNSLLRSDSLSEGEPESTERRFDQLSLVPSDVSDCESRLSASTDPSSSSIPRRYSKRPLRGPYGQMLEAEMKKPESRKNISSDLKFLEDLSSSSTSRNKHSRSRGCNSSIDETYLKEAKSLPVTKRKVSADNLMVEPVTKHTLLPNHQRTTSSPSKLEGFSQTPEVSSELLEQLLRGSSERLESKEPGPQIPNDTRTHVIIELFDNEKIYVESLQILISQFWEPLKKTDGSLIDPVLVEELFSQVPYLRDQHKLFLENLKTRLNEDCENRANIGDLLMRLLSDPVVIESYVNYVNNWKKSREVIKQAQTARPNFAKFLETAMKSNSMKLSLDSLLIKPIQKFPKLKLLLQRLLKHTSEDHPDFDYLCRAEKEVHEQLLKLNCTEKEAVEIDQLRELESVIEGALELVSFDRQFMRQDIVVMSYGGGVKKERAFFLLTDLLLITVIKRKTTPKKTSSSGSSTNTDPYKYKLMMKIPLDDIEIIPIRNSHYEELQLETQKMSKDIDLLNDIHELSAKLNCNHSSLDDVVKDMVTNLNKGLKAQERTDLIMSHFTVSTQKGVEIVSIIFPESEVRFSWEYCISECKTKLGKRPPPELVSTVAFRKIRSGLQFSCVAPSLSDGRDIWVGSNDTLTGQICHITLNEKLEPNISSCNGFGANRVACITSVPGPSFCSSSIRNRDKLQQQRAFQFDSDSSGDEPDPTEDEHKGAETCSDEPDKLCTMWIGNDDGSIFVVNANDHIRLKKHKLKIQLGSAVLCIVYLDHRVFVSQENGNIAIFERDGKGGWNTNNPRQVPVGNGTVAVTKMVAWTSMLFCGCGDNIVLFNPNNLEKAAVCVLTDPKAAEPLIIQCMLVHGNSLLASLQLSAIVKCYNAVTHDLLYEIDITPTINTIFHVYDDIIRQHKAACLRVTGLVRCKDLLWIGTSSGALLTMPFPHVTHSTGKFTIIPPLTAQMTGHIGQVRILTSVEVPCSYPRKGTPTKKRTKADIPQSQYVVISGGDGYEDFKTQNTSEGLGREDSTNFLLIWKI